MGFKLLADNSKNKRAKFRATVLNGLKTGAWCRLSYTTNVIKGFNLQLQRGLS